MRSKLLALFLSLGIPAVASAQLPDRFIEFIRANDPETLEYWYEHDAPCPWAEEEAESVIAGVIKRSRIKTSEGVGGVNDVYLNTKVTCAEIAAQGGGSPLGITVHFEIFFGDFPLFYERRYGSLVTLGNAGQKDFALDSLKVYIEGAVTDFVEVNFLMDDQ